MDSNNYNNQNYNNYNNQQYGPNNNPYMQNKNVQKKKHPILIFILIVILLLLCCGCFSFFSIVGSSDEFKKEFQKDSKEQEKISDVDDKKTDDVENIVYLEINAKEMLEDLRNNALNAEEKYTNAYVAVSGKLNNIDSDGKYIDIIPKGELIAFPFIQCYLKDDSQLDVVRTLSLEDNIVVYGKCTQVGEALGFSIDIDKIEQPNSVNNVEENIIVEPSQEIEQSANVDGSSSSNQTDESVDGSNALDSANSYLNFAAFSKEGLKDQLKYEQYTDEDINNVVDNLKIDWNEQALKCAKSYIEYSAFSEKGLRSQLEYEKYTNENIDYAFNNLVVDWNEQAAKSASLYMSVSSFLKEELIGQLEYDGYSNEQANYGVSQNGY